MAYAQTNSLSSTKGRLLKGEKGLAYWCMSAILYSLFFLLILSFILLCFVTYSFFLFSFFSFLMLTHVAYSDVVILSCGSYCPSLLVHGKGPLYTTYRD